MRQTKQKPRQGQAARRRITVDRAAKPAPGAARPAAATHPSGPPAAMTPAALPAPVEECIAVEQQLPAPAGGPPTAPLAGGPPTAASHAGDLVPRLDHQGFAAADVGARRRWVEERTGVELPHVAASSVALQAGEPLRGKIENPIGAAQVPLGVAGPLAIRGVWARGVFYVPLATTEGALVRSYERGMVALTRAGGAVAQLGLDENRVAPVFVLDGVEEAHRFCAELERSFGLIREAAESTTRHGKLLRLEPHALGREVIVTFCYSTGDANGMNMIVKATDQACQWIAAHCGARRYYIASGMDSEKRASGALLAGGKGKRVVAGARLPARLVRAYLRTTPEAMRELWEHTVLGHLLAGAVGYNGQYANGLAALFIACGQDVANVANSAVGITRFSVMEGGDLYASVTLPSLTLATVGGGTGLGTARECLAMLGCAGDGGAPKLAEIVAATLLAGELSMGAAIASGELVAAHETYGRNRPPAAPDR
ncbi:MAG TPA: hydroxymethylglutaryl-CoA reductase [Thermoanaerobaculia bacterium]|nr:hydroxymethylglutaryl-CoA reductase [Thermoanaerobaculia bacterium]